MRKFLSLFMILLVSFCLLGCSKNKVAVDYGNSSIYSQEDMDKAVAIILEEFAKFEGCELKALRYAGDECNSQENIDWMNQLKPNNYTQCIEFLMDFHTPKENSGAWNPDSDYPDWQWYLARQDGGNWELLTNGY